MTGIKKRLGSLLGPAGKAGTTAANIRFDEIERTSNNAITRVEHIETIAGLAPGDVTDVQTANLLHQPDSSTRHAFGQALASEINASGTEGSAALNSRIDQRAVTGVGVTRIVASIDPNYPIEPGELLILLRDPRPQFFTDFSEYPTRAGVPQGWSAYWDAPDDWAILEDPAATGGKYLSSSTTQPSQRRLLVWDDTRQAAMQHADQEVVFKWRATNEGIYTRAVLRAQHVQEGQNGYWVGGNAYRWAAGVYTDGTSALVGANQSDILPNVWYITRARLEGHTLSARTWDATTPEPNTWDLVATDATITDPGDVGLLAAGRDNLDFDFIGVGFDGAAAPMQEV